ncbi:MAG: sugar-transfer associated ATP-grasp domain-containing protein [Anaerovoracaceae bacterium]
MFKFAKKCIKKLKLFLLYFRRIIFAKNHFKCPFYKKVRANICGGYLADQWMLYDFDHNDKKEYLSEFDWYRSRYINEPFDFILNNKIAAAEVLKQYIRVPESYMIKNKGFLSSFDSKGMEYEDAVTLLKEKGKLFIKPYGAGKGTGVNILIYQDGQLFVDRTPYTDEELIQFLKDRDDWFICESMKQHHYSDAIYDKTVNTIRMITLRDIDTHKFKIFFAVQRIGTSDTIPVDNGSRGGLVSKIDLDTGVLSEARCLHNLNVYKVHPDSGAQIEGAVIPDWEDMKTQILELTNKLPYMHFIAWDILKTEEGICIIEANTSSGVNIIQLWGGQRNKELGDFYRYHKVIKK